MKRRDYYQLPRIQSEIWMEEFWKKIRHRGLRNGNSIWCWVEEDQSWHGGSCRNCRRRICKKWILQRFFYRTFLDVYRTPPSMPRACRPLCMLLSCGLYPPMIRAPIYVISWTHEIDITRPCIGKRTGTFQINGSLVVNAMKRALRKRCKLVNLLRMEFWTPVRDNEEGTRRRAGEVWIMVSLTYKSREEKESKAN